MQTQEDRIRHRPQIGRTRFVISYNRGEARFTSEFFSLVEAMKYLESIIDQNKIEVTFSVERFKDGVWHESSKYTFDDQMELQLLLEYHKKYLKEG